MRYLVISLIFVVTCGLVFIAASAAVLEVADMIGMGDWRGDAENDTFHFHFAATMGLMVFSLACGCYTARKCWREAGK